MGTQNSRTVRQND